MRSNFTQNVLRAARNTPQDRGWLAGLRAWWQENTVAGGLTLAGGAAAAMVLAFVVMQPAEQPASHAVMPPPVEDLSLVSDMPLLPETEAPWDSSLQTESLLAVEDTSLLTDSEISFLLY